MEREVPADFVHEDEWCVAIKDINPKAPIHWLIIPRKPIRGIADLVEEDKELVSHMIFTAQKLAKEAGTSNFRLQFNTGEKAGQTVFHLHLHLMGWL